MAALLTLYVVPVGYRFFSKPELKEQ